MHGALTVVCWSGIYGLGSIEIGFLRPIITLPLDRKSGSPESHASLFPDINKPPLRCAVLYEAGLEVWYELRRLLVANRM
jgi:hypothetical protein